MGNRKYHYIEIILSQERVKKITEGRTVQIMVAGQRYAVFQQQTNPVKLKIEGLERQIAELKRTLKPAKTAVKKYHKRNTDYWTSGKAKENLRRAREAKALKAKQMVG